MEDQYAGDGVAGRGPGYGMQTIRVDGNDVWAVYSATREARRLIRETGRPALIEAMSYRIGGCCRRIGAEEGGGGTQWGSGPRLRSHRRLAAGAGHHSTSDDSTRYRSADEIEHWRAIDPISRMRQYLIAKQWWSEDEDKEFNKKIRKTVLKALNAVRLPRSGLIAAGGWQPAPLLRWPRSQPLSLTRVLPAGRAAAAVSRPRRRTSRTVTVCSRTCTTS